MHNAQVRSGSGVLPEMEAKENQNEAILPQRVDAIAKSDPGRIYAEFPISFSDYEQGFRSISYSQLANAVNGAAWWLVNTFGVGENFATLAYTGPNDLRYPIIVLGAVKAGYKILLTSPRNSIPAQSNLFELLECNKLIVSDPEPPHVPALKEHLDIIVQKFPSLLDLLDTHHKHYPYAKTFDEARDEPLVVIHTSGSTGLPKPLVLPHAFGSYYANIQQAKPPEGFLDQSHFFHGVRLIHTMPMFHAAGIYHSLVSTIFSKTVFIHLKPSVPPSGEGVGEALRYVKAEAAFIAPSLVEEIGSNADLLQYLSTSLDTICFAGGAVSKPIGDAVAAKMRLISLYGSSELGQGIQMRVLSPTSGDDWSYHRWNEDLQGMEFREEARDLYQMVIVKNSKLQPFQTPFTIFPTLDEFPTKDLFSPHPSVPGLWRHAGRTDDVIVLLNGEKTNPVTMEGHISSHPKVRSALVAGEQRLQTTLLLELISEPPVTAQGRAQLIEELWPTVSRANLDSPAHAKVTKDHVLFVKPEKPMARAGKGTVIRRATLQLYAEELDTLYKEPDALGSVPLVSQDAFPIDAGDQTNLCHSVARMAKEITGWESLNNDDDFFTLGMDSLQAIQLARCLKSRLRSLDATINTIYLHPSATALAHAIMETTSANKTSEAAMEQARMGSISSTLQSHISTLDKLGGRSILLTGSTGFVGSYVLRSLLRESTIAQVYCLKRPSKENSSRASKERVEGYAELLKHRKVTVLTGDLSETNFGLPESAFQELQDSLDLVIHAAWAVNFNRGLNAYDSQLRGIVNLITFCRAASSSPTILFLSSISSVYHCSSPVPEMIMADRSAPSRTGYGESKYIAERLLEHAAQTLGQKVMVVRTGQICGPSHGTGGWNKHEWLPSLVASSAYLRALPSSLGQPQDAGSAPTSCIDWVPVDQFADVLVDVAQHAAGPPRERLGPRGALFLHITHPHPTTWEAFLPTIIATLESWHAAHTVNEMRSHTAVTIVPFRDWVDRLQASAPAGGGDDPADLATFLDRNPAIKLLDFYQGMARGQLAPALDAQVAQGVSRALRHMDEVRPERMHAWMQGWLADAP